MDTDEYFNKRERVIENLKRYKNAAPSNLYKAMNDLIESPNSTQEQKEEAIDRLTFELIQEERNELTNDLFSHSIRDTIAIEGPADPNIRQEGFKLFQDEFKNAAAKAGLKLGQKVTERLYDKYKGTKPKTSTAPQIQSDETRIQKAKVVEEVKPKAKEKPIRNIKDDLRFVGKAIRGIPLMLSGDVNQEELLKQQRRQAAEQMADTEMKVDIGPVNRDPYKSYNLQRAI